MNTRVLTLAAVLWGVVASFATAEPSIDDSTLVDRSTTAEISAYFREDAMNTVPLGWAVLGIGGLLMIIAVIAAARWLRNNREQPHPLWVFSQIASEAGLAYRDQFLLWRISRKEALPSPMTLLFSPNTLIHHADRYAEPLPLRRQKHLAMRILHIRDTLFEKNPRRAVHVAA